MKELGYLATARERADQGTLEALRAELIGSTRSSSEHWVRESPSAEASPTTSASTRCR